MKKILSVLAVLAVASGVVFAVDNSFEGRFRLETSIEEQPHVFFLSVKPDGDALADNTVVKNDVDLTKAGSYNGVSLWIAAGGNHGKDVMYKVTVSNTGFEGANKTHPATVILTEPDKETPSVTAGPTANITVGAGPTEKMHLKTVKVDWVGDPKLPADTYVDTITVTVAVAN